MKHIKKFSTRSDYYTFRSNGECIEPFIYTCNNSEVIYNKKYYFGGVQIAPGPCYYDGTGLSIKDTWGYTSFNGTNTISGKVLNSSAFTYLDAGSFFDSEGNSFSESSGYIDNMNTLNGWRLPTLTEWNNIVYKENSNIYGDYRVGSIVNGNPESYWTLVWVDNTRSGLLIFPDNETISGASLTQINKSTSASQINRLTTAQVNEYIYQGCVFISSSGMYTGSDWYYDKTFGCYWLADSDTNYVKSTYIMASTAGNMCVSKQELNKTKSLCGIWLVK